MTQNEERGQGQIVDARLNLGLPYHPKTRKLQRRLGPAGPWALVCLILWAGHHRPSGSLKGLDVEDIEIAAMWEGEPGAFVREAVAVGFLDEDGEHYVLHDWSTHQPWLAGREQRSERARKAAHARHHGRESAERMHGACDSHAGSSDEHAGGSDPHAESNAPSPSPSPSPSPNPSPSGGRRATQIPEDFMPDDKLVAWAQANVPGVDPYAEAERFADYHRSKGNTFKDHRAAFRTWLRKAAEFSRGASASSGGRRRVVV